MIYEEKLGKRREGWCVYLEKSGDFTFWSDKQVKARLAAGEVVNGLTTTETGEVVMDESFTTALLSKTGLANFTPIREDEDGSLANKYYAVVRVIRSKAGAMYELVTNRCGVNMVDEAKLKAMASLIEIGGVQLDVKGRVVLHKGVTVDDGQTAPDKATEGVS
ncbi:MAG: hypothetical protein ACI3VJ_05190 [Hominicoprocola sp.]